MSYDKVHRKNPYYRLKSTAYSALISRTATCQGFCAALYRLLRGCGISCRIVTGTADGEDTLHAWVIAEVGGAYYNLDPAWDAGRAEYQWFLVGSRAFASHVPSARFLDTAFAERYPIAEESYRKEGSE